MLLMLLILLDDLILLFSSFKGVLNPSTEREIIKYEVNEHDTLTGLSIKFNMSIRDLQKLNRRGNMKNRTEREIIKYEVNEHDTLTGLSIKFNMSIRDLQKLNRLVTDQLYQGQEIKVYKPVRKTTHRNKSTTKEPYLVSLKNKYTNIYNPPNTKEYIDTAIEYNRKTRMKSHHTNKYTDHVIYLKEDIEITGNIFVNHEAFIFEADVSNKYIELIDGYLNGQIFCEMRTTTGCNIENMNDIEVIMTLTTVNTQYRFIVNKKNINDLYQRIVSWIPDATDTPTPEITYTDDFSGDKPVDKSFLPKMHKGQSDILNTDSLKLLAESLPERYRRKDWVLLYSSTQHGISINTFYSKTNRKGPSILIIEDSKGYVFGTYCSESWDRKEKHFYGTGECFLFSTIPEFVVYPWTEKNNFFMNSNDDSLAIGGGGNGFGIWIDADFYHGTSASCETFDNPPLSMNGDFVCSILECWGFKDDDSHYY
eukprot:TRINITY_DN2625_c1_g1_i2.p1 TRINITY_DN2625_c1_g1~~TRINITY_DN2625_c1_g1_i2.p1  ORF type:complete len:480 (-),score=77.24 TRINITY_DN2625_c1_g1_i2:590-2029(-)